MDMELWAELEVKEETGAGASRGRSSAHAEVACDQ